MRPAWLCRPRFLLLLRCRIPGANRRPHVPFGGAHGSRLSKFVRAVRALGGARTPPAHHIWGTQLPKCLARLLTSLLGLPVAQLDPPDLSGQSLGQVGDELDPAWVGVAGKALADEALDLIGELVGSVVPAGEDDEGLDH
jgi:hypothetical protein